MAQQGASRRSWRSIRRRDALTLALSPLTLALSRRERGEVQRWRSRTTTLTPTLSPLTLALSRRERGRSCRCCRPRWTSGCESTAAVLGISLFLAASTLLVYGQTAWFDFITFDDGQYVESNRHVQEGITLDSLTWAFTSTHAANWHPLTWLTHMLDWTLYGKWAGGHHLTNVLLHAASCVVLFLALRRLTGATWRSGLVAALFGLHPAHVESVAWVSERKDVLSGLFFGLTLWAYGGYAKKESGVRSQELEVRSQELEAEDDPGLRPQDSSLKPQASGLKPQASGHRTQDSFPWGRYLLVVVFFALGLLSKPMLVTLPLVLLLLDYWPLGRWGKSVQCSVFSVQCSDGEGETGRKGEREKGRTPSPPAPLPEGEGRSAPFLLLEKVPLVALSAASCVATYLVQRSAGAVVQTVAPEIRVQTVVLSYARYLAMLVWPFRLATPYTRDREIYETATVLCGLALAAITAAVLLLCRRRWRYVLVGWLWFVGMLVPVSGVVLVGDQAIADRYTYLTYTGLFVAVVWGVAEMLGAGSGEQSKPRSLATRSCSMEKTEKRSAPRWAWAVAGGVLAFCALRTVQQVRTWRDSEALYRQVLVVMPENFVAHSNLGIILDNRGELEEAEKEFREAIRIEPDDYQVHDCLGVIERRRGNLPAALEHYYAAIRSEPKYALAHNNLAVAYADLGRFAEAEQECLLALKYDPELADAENNLGAAHVQRKDWKGAIEHFRRAIELDSAQARYHHGLAGAFFAEHSFPEGIEELKKAIELEPEELAFRQELAESYVTAGRPIEALQAWSEVLKLHPGDIRAAKGIGTIAVKTRKGNGVPFLQAAVAADPRDAQTRLTLAEAHALAKQYPEAIADCRAVLRDAQKTRVPTSFWARFLISSGHGVDAVGPLQAALAEAPQDLEARQYMVFARLAARQTPDALAAFRDVLRQDPKNGQVLAELAKLVTARPKDAYTRSFAAYALVEAKLTAAAAAEFREVIGLEAKNVGALNSLAWIEATCPDAKLRNGKEAVRLAETAAGMRKDDPQTLDTLAAAYAEAGRFKEAVATAKKAEQLVQKSKDRDLSAGIAARMKLYEAEKPFRDGSLADVPAGLAK